jgi:hypothetical protein
MGAEGGEKQNFFSLFLHRLKFWLGGMRACAFDPHQWGGGRGGGNGLRSYRFIGKQCASQVSQTYIFFQKKFIIRR